MASSQSRRRKELVIHSSRPWRLSHVLSGHKSDVKAVAATRLFHQDAIPAAEGDDIELIQSASRDETARSWFRQAPLNERDPSRFKAAATYNGQRYQNAVTHCQVQPGPADGMTIIGGLDAQIRVYQTRSTYSDKPQSKPTQILNDHYDNVCHLSVKEGVLDTDQTLLISASWDCTSRVWAWHGVDEHWRILHTLKGHERAVWAAEIVSNRSDEERYLTASADLFVRLWHGETTTRIFSGHTDVVRGIVLLPTISCLSKQDYPSEVSSDANKKPFFDSEELFATTSNDGTLRVWSLDERRCPEGIPTSGGEALRVLKVDDGGVDLIYDACFVGLEQAEDASEEKHRLVATCGEGGLVRAWNIDAARVAFEIDQPIASVWGIDTLPVSGDLVTANSDGLVRVYTQRPEPSDPDAKGVTDSVNAINEVSEAELAEHNALCDEIALKRRKNRVRADIIAQETTETEAWRVDGASDISDGKLKHSDGRLYDAILKIDVSDDAEPLSLPMNRGDDARQRAKEFVTAHDLPAVYEDQIVAFIEQVGPK